jgi:hypothetical protein
MMENEEFHLCVGIEYDTQGHKTYYRICLNPVDNEGDDCGNHNWSAWFIFGDEGE